VNRSDARTRIAPAQTSRHLPALRFIPEIISRIPRPYPPSQQEFGALITSELIEILWRNVMTDAERESAMTEAERLQDDANNQSSIDCEKFNQNGKLDALILKQAETFGWRLLFSEMVLRRFAEWEILHDGPELFERFGKACARSVRRSQKKEPRPIDDPDLRHSKFVAVAELRLLLKNLRNEFSTARTTPTTAVISERFAATVTAEPDTFEYLHKNLESWKRFFEDDPSSIKALAFGRTLSPALLFDSWLAWWKGRDVDSVRQQLSRMSKI